MAKQHVYNALNLRKGDKNLEIKNQFVTLYANVDFSVTHDGDVGPDGKGISTDHTARFEMEMKHTTLLKLALKQIIVHLQNKILRKMTADMARKWLREHNPIKFDDVYSGRRTVVKKEMTPDEVRERCKNDPVFREEFLKSIGAM